MAAALRRWPLPPPRPSLARTLPPPLLDLATREVTLEEVVDLGDDILQGKLTGRTVVRLDAG